MNLQNFAKEARLLEQVEIEKTRLLAFFHLMRSEQEEFTIKDIDLWFQQLGFAQPNPSRLKSRIVGHRDFVKGRKSDHFRLHVRAIKALQEAFPKIVVDDEVISYDTVLPSSLYQVNRVYIESLGRQINASYENKIYDGCAVLMRRLLEVLLILSYEELGIQGSIKGSDGNYFLLEKIVRDAVTNGRLSLSRNSKSCLDIFRQLGNFSAHKIYYSCKKQYIEEVILEYRAAIEELLHKSGLIV